MGELDEGLAAFGGRVEHHARQAVARRLGQPHIARDHGVEHLVAEMLFQLIADLLLQGDGGSSAVMIILMQILRASLFVNLALMAFNLFPLAPLDGSKILYVFLPDDWQEGYDRFMQYGQWILLFLIFGESLLPFPLLSSWVGSIMSTVLSLFNMIM